MKKLFDKKFLLYFIVFNLFLFFYNEYLIYYQVLIVCNWPTKHNDNLLNLMLISDTHLLGSRNGHWFDKLRREWQMHRSFQTARHLLKPDYIVIMGDLTDEGKWCSDLEWKYYENRVHELFYTDSNTKLLIVVGNHDIGFHYDINSHKLERFNRSFNTKYLNLHQSTGKNLNINFVLINSMSLENDGCTFCQKTQSELKRMNKTLTCLKNENNCTWTKHLNGKYSSPIVFTHYPLYRDSDSICPNDIDTEMAIINKNPKFKPNFDCLSLDSTNKLIDLLQPRLVFNGHTHYSCYNTKHNVPEHTIPSFSWRNIKIPSMLLVQVNENDYFHSKCFLPNENHVFNLYTFMAVLALVYALLFILYKCKCCLYYLKINSRNNKLFLSNFFIKQN